MKYFIDVLKKYKIIDGRSSRKEYWMFTLFFYIFYILTLIGDRLFFNFKTYNINGIGVLEAFFAVILIMPAIAVTIRRLHDTNRSGWWLLLSLIPIIGWIVLLVFTVIDSTPGDNKYGSNPKGISAT